MKMPSTSRFKPGDRVIHSVAGMCIVKDVVVDGADDLLYLVAPKKLNPFWTFELYLRNAPKSITWDEESL